MKTWKIILVCMAFVGALAGFIAYVNTGNSYALTSGLWATTCFFCYLEDILTDKD